jgi:membrane-associated HD superfamily phosphohydrolase
MSALDTLVEFGKKFEQLGKIGKVAVVSGAAFMFFSFGECSNYDKLKEFEIKYKNLQAETLLVIKIANENKEKVAILTAEARNKDTTITRLTASIETSQLQREKLKGSLAVLEDNLDQSKDTVEMFYIQQGIIENLKDQNEEADKIIVSQQEVIQNQRYQILKLDQALVLSNQRGDLLEGQLNKFTALKMPTPKKPLISRKILGIAAFTGGVYVGNVLAR